MADEKLKTTGPLEPGQRKSTVVWDDSDMATNFANVVNIQDTKDQIEVLFGTNRT